MLILSSDMYTGKKPPCVREIMDFLRRSGTSFLLYDFGSLIPIESNLHLIKDIFPWYYTPSGAVSGDTYIRNMYGNLFYIDLFSFPEELYDLSVYTDEKFKHLYEYVQNSINATMYIHEYELQTLLETTNFTYNPIENYSMTETETSNLSENGGINSNYTEGQNGTTETSIGAITRTENKTNTLPNRTEESTRKVAPYDNEDFYNKEKTTTTFTASTTDVTATTATDNAHTDNATTATNVNGTNSTESTNKQNMSRTLTRSGNIGVMSTQDMIEQERRVANFSLFKKFMELFASDNLMLVD